MSDQFVAFGSRDYYLLLGCVVFSRAMDFFSTWVATPNLLLEANPDWGIEIAQIILDGPLTETVYPDVYFEHLARRPVPVERHGDPATSNV